MSRIQVTSKKNFFASFFKKVNPFQTEKRKDKINSNEENGEDPFENDEMIKSGHGNSGKRNKKTDAYRNKRNKTNRIKRQSRRANLRRGE